MAKKSELTLEELTARKIRRSNGWTRFWAIVLALVLVSGVAYFANNQAKKANEEAEAEASSLAAEYANSNAGVQSWSDGSASGGNNSAAPVSNEAEEAAKAINEATAAAAAAGYTWNRTSEFTKDIDVGGSTATNAINTVIQAVDSNANINSVVGGFIGIGTKDATIAKGADAAEAIGYHGDSYKLKATSLEAADLQGLTKNGDTYTFTLTNAETPKKDGSTALNRLTDDIVTQEEVSAEIQEQVGSSITVSSLVGTYSNIKVEVTITDGKLQKLTYSYDAEVTELGLKVAILTVKGTGAMHTEATYSDFVY